MLLFFTIFLYPILHVYLYCSSQYASILIQVIYFKTMLTIAKHPSNFQFSVENLLQSTIYPKIEPSNVPQIEPKLVVLAGHYQSSTPRSIYLF